MIRRGILSIFILFSCFYVVKGQSEVIQIAETKEEYIKENHIEDIEEMVHNFMNSDEFLSFLLRQGHDIDPDQIQLKRKDVNVGEDLDVYVKHITDHQNFTLLLVPISIYPLNIYDTLLFSVLEVSDEWLGARFFNNDLEDDSVKAHLLTVENHTLLSKHMYDQALSQNYHEVTQAQISLHESYISTSSIPVHVKDLDDSEKKEIRKRWGVMKKALMHNISMNVEMNVYIFGYDDMEVVYLTKRGSRTYKITPQNVFTRHEFLDAGG